jgi:hypothetical protein
MGGVFFIWRRMFENSYYMRKEREIYQAAPKTDLSRLFATVFLAPGEGQPDIF